MGSPRHSHSLMTQLDYRARIYDSYVHARDTALAPASVEGFASRAPYLRRLVRDHFPRDRSAPVLELGCGHGTLIYFARLAGYTDVTGVDRSPEQVLEAERLGIDGVREGDLMEVLRAVPDEALELVIAFDVIEHFTREELLPFADEVRRVLRRGGQWLIHTPNAESPFFGRIRYGDLTHEQAFTRTSMGQLLLSSDFASYRCYEDSPVIHGVASALRYIVWKGVRGLLRVYLAAETGSRDPSFILSQNFLTVAVK
ncbi:MAG: class I SAM-dependent methyltransferase [Gemmatimonadaceae bacterium]